MSPRARILTAKSVNQINPFLGACALHQYLILACAGEPVCSLSSCHLTSTHPCAKCVTTNSLTWRTGIKSVCRPTKPQSIQGDRHNLDIPPHLLTTYLNHSSSRPGIPGFHPSVTLLALQPPAFAVSPWHFIPHPRSHYHKRKHHGLTLLFKLHARGAVYRQIPIPPDGGWR